MSDFDVLVIGGGPGGYVAAIRAAQHGLKVGCVESRPTLGGTCLNVGCIPSKALLHSSELFAAAVSGAHGFMVASATPDVAQIMATKDGIVKKLTGGIDGLFRKNKVTRLNGHGRLTGPGRVDVGGKEWSARHVILATGSRPARLKGVEVDNDTGVIVDSTGALALGKVPRRMIVIGGGVIGLELGSVWARYGAEVTVLEYQDRILPGMDSGVRDEMARLLSRQGLKLRTGVAVASAEVTEGCARVHVTAGDQAETLEADVVLVATGRVPNTDGLGLDAVGVTTERGFVPVDDHGRSTVDGIWAIGDVAGGLMLAHKAEDEGIAVADAIAGKAGGHDLSLVPAVVYTQPECASVGLTEEAARDTGRKIAVGTFLMAANSRAVANDEAGGFVKIVTDAATDRVLGVHIIAAQAGTMIAQAVQAMEFGATSEDIAYTCHAHPTHSEAMKEAALAVREKPLHM